jgi:Flp pilus assembly pilin Flp
VKQEVGQAVVEYSALVAIVAVTMILLLVGFGLDLVGIAADQIAELGDDLTP